MYFKIYHTERHYESLQTTIKSPKLSSNEPAQYLDK